MQILINREHLVKSQMNFLFAQINRHGFYQSFSIIRNLNILLFMLFYNTNIFLLKIYIIQINQRVKKKLMSENNKCSQELIFQSMHLHPQV